MLLLPLGIFLYFIGVIILRNQRRPLAALKRCTGKLVGYLKNEGNGEFHPVVSFSYNTDKYFFKNTVPYKVPRFALGSEQTVYYEAPKEPIIAGTPLKATLGLSKDNWLLSWILMCLGMACILLFSQLTGFYFLLVALLIAFRLVYTWLNNTSLFDNHHIEIAHSDRYPLSNSFLEDEFLKMKLLDLSSLRIYRERWIEKQRSNGFLLIILATLCLVFTQFSTPPEAVSVPKTVAPAKKALTIDQVLDAGSLEAAEDNNASTERAWYCIWFESDSCYFTYLSLEEHEMQMFYEKVFNFFITDCGFILLFFSLICFASRKIFIQHDTPLDAQIT